MAENCHSENIWHFKNPVKVPNKVKGSTGLENIRLFFLVVVLVLNLLPMNGASAAVDFVEPALNSIDIITKVNNNDQLRLPGKVCIEFSSHDLTLTIEQTQNLSLIFTIPVIDFQSVKPETIVNTEDQIELYFNFSSNSDSLFLKPLPNITVNITGSNQTSYSLSLFPELNGHTILFAQTESNMTDLTNAFVRLSIRHSEALAYVSEVVGWTYFLAWSISFYPQTVLNWKRKSVIGLHFDFLALNTMGFFLYSVFNIGLYWIPSVEEAYHLRHPHGVNPVQLNDVIFSIHAFFACIIQIIQCLIYERGDQRVSKTGKSLLGSMIVISLITLILSSSSVIAWLDFLYFLSYIKLFITLIKYIPQAYYNYLRKSTSGWSIGNIILDFTGGSLSILQMFLLAFNYNDWSSIFGDPTKFGLGMFSILFDIFFIIQHYILYRGHENYIPLPESPIMSHPSFAESLNSVHDVYYGSTNSYD